MSTQTIEQQLNVLPQVYNALSPLQQGWLQMSEVKRRLFEKLTSDEILIADKLKQIDALMIVDENDYNALNKNLEAVQTIIKESSELYAESKAMRLNFTNEITKKLIEPAMAFEKRTEILLEDKKQKELSLRLKFATLENQKRAKQAEEQQLKVHIEHEHFRIEQQYKLRLKTLINESYVYALKSKIKPKELKTYINDHIKKFLKEEPLPPFIPFNRILVNRDEAMNIYQSIPQYDATNDLNLALASIDDVFAMYESDFKKADKAIENAKKQLEEITTETETSIAQEKAIDQLRGQVSTTVTTGGAKSKIKTKVEIEYINNDAWLIDIVSAFQKNWAKCRQYIKVKEVNKISVDQMAKALAAYATENLSISETDTQSGKVFPGLTIKIIQK